WRWRCLLFLLQGETAVGQTPLSGLDDRLDKSAWPTGRHSPFPAGALPGTMKPMSTSAAILGPGGAIAPAPGHHQTRPQQLVMADAVADAIASCRHLMVEAGTGVGKSFAYLVPALLAAAADKECRIVVSTHTISLQEQLIRKDIPFLQDVMPQEFRAV